MSENLSFTQELREKGLIITDEVSTPTENITEQKEETNDNENDSFDQTLIYIGKKPSMNYVLAINSRMIEGLDEITIKARGKTISKAVDVAEIVTNRFVTDANDNEVKISTEEIVRDDGTKTNVSTIEIVIKR
jgi:DNA-binding protein